GFCCQNGKLGIIPCFEPRSQGSLCVRAWPGMWAWGRACLAQPGMHNACGIRQNKMAVPARDGHLLCGIDASRSCGRVATHLITATRDRKSVVEGKRDDAGRAA